MGNERTPNHTCVSRTCERKCVQERKGEREEDKEREREIYGRRWIEREKMGKQEKIQRLQNKLISTIVDSVGVYKIPRLLSHDATKRIYGAHQEPMVHTKNLWCTAYTLSDNWV